MSPDPTSESVDRAFEKWADIIGEQHTDRSESTRELASTATYPTPHEILGAIRPDGASEVQACVEVANETGVPVYPISRGRNSGYGSMVPPGSDAVLLDLRRMDRILNFDRELACVTVEPGVTRVQIHEYLEEHAPELMYPQQSGWPDASMVGHALERGTGWGPDMGPKRPTHDLEVVTPEGKLIHTGIDRFAGARAAGIQPHAPGPNTTGLFRQSSLGVVTKMKFWLSKKPDDLRVVYAQIEDPDRLPGFLAKLREALMDRIVHPWCEIGNPHLLALLDRGGYPFDELGGETLPASPDEYPWLFVCPIYTGDSKLGKKRASLLKKRLSSEADRMFVNTSVTRWVEGKLLRPARTLLGDNVGDMLQDLHEDIVGMKGDLPDKSRKGRIRSVYWRKREPVPDDPDLRRDGVGLFFNPFVAPNRPGDVTDVMETMERIFYEYDFEPAIKASFRTPRSVNLDAMLLYDRDVPEEEERAVACHDELYDQLIDKGYYPKRMSTRAMNSLPQPRDDWGWFAKTLKQSLDPNDVVSPGRYDFRNWWPED